MKIGDELVWHFSQCWPSLLWILWCLVNEASVPCIWGVCFYSGYIYCQCRIWCACDVFLPYFLQGQRHSTEMVVIICIISSNCNLYYSSFCCFGKATAVAFFRAINSMPSAFSPYSNETWCCLLGRENAVTTATLAYFSVDSPGYTRILKGK